jgi:hypothetical protein
MALKGRVARLERRLGEISRSIYGEPLSEEELKRTSISIMNKWIDHVSSSLNHISPYREDLIAVVEKTVEKLKSIDPEDPDAVSRFSAILGAFLPVKKYIWELYLSASPAEQTKWDYIRCQQRLAKAAGS